MNFRVSHICLLEKNLRMIHPFHTAVDSIHLSRPFTSVRCTALYGGDVFPSFFLGSTKLQRADQTIRYMLCLSNIIHADCELTGSCPSRAQQMNINETGQGWSGGQGDNTGRPAHRTASSLKKEQCGNRLLYHRLGCISSPYLPRWPCALQEGDESIYHPKPPR